MTRIHPVPERSDRAVSTVLDAAIFLLLVSAAVGLFYTVPDSDGGSTDPDVAAETSTTLATSIQTIEYRPAPGGQVADGTTNRTDRGTIAELLADATIANARYRGESFTTSPNYEAAVRAATRRTIREISEGVAIQIRSRWRPLDGSGLRGSIVVGPSPPSGADVHAATISVPVGSAKATGPTGRSEDTGTATTCRGLATDVATTVVGTAFPHERTDLAMRIPGQQAELLRTRYRVAANGLGLDPASYRSGMAVAARNRLLVDELSRPLAAACEGYESSEIATERAAPETVLVSVRTWSP